MAAPRFKLRTGPSMAGRSEGVDDGEVAGFIGRKPRRRRVAQAVEGRDHSGEFGWLLRTPGIEPAVAKRGGGADVSPLFLGHEPDVR